MIELGHITPNMGNFSAGPITSFYPIIKNF